jgi:hypothetical protein
MEQHPPAMFGHAITETSEADELKQTWKLREKHVKIFGRDCTDGFDNLFLMRSGCPK